MLDTDTGSALIRGQMEEKVITQTATGENPPPSASAALVVTPGHTADKASPVF